MYNTYYTIRTEQLYSFRLHTSASVLSTVHCRVYSSPAGEC